MRDPSLDRLTLDAAIDLLGRLVAFDTVSVRSNLALIRFVAGYLDSLGVTSHLSHDPTGEKANLFATVGPEVDGGVVLSGHTDVVPVEGQHWTGDPFVVEQREGLLHGRGTADMKGFIACVLAEVPALLAADLRRPVHLGFTFDEEIGTCGAPYLIEQMATLPYRPRIAIIGEPTSMGIIAGHKGGYELTTTITGLEGHASMPAKGVNAIEWAARFMAILDEKGREIAARADPESPFDPPHSTISVGSVHGGAARNIIAGSCTFEWEIRLHPGDDGDAILRSIEERAARELLPRMHAAAPESGIATSVEARFPGLAYKESADAVALIRELTGVDAWSVVSFGTDAGHFCDAGMSTVVYGPGSIEQAHRPDEFIAVEQLEACLGFLGQLRESLAAPRIG